MAKRTTKLRALPVPKTKEEATQLLGEIGALQQKLFVLEANLNERIEALKSEAGRMAAPDKEELSMKLDALHAYSEAHREELTPGKRKTAVFPTGTISWRTTPSSVRIADTKKVLGRIRKLRLIRFIRIVQEINKEAMLADKAVAESIEGVSITQREEFIVKPARTVSEIVKRIPLKRPSLKKATES